MSETIDTTAEEWKTIAEFPDYSVSSNGMVRRDYTVGGHASKLQKSHPQKDGYLKVTLCRNGLRKMRYVARLVAFAFLEQDPLRNEVNHKNGVKGDCNKRNLEWSTRSENMKHSYDVLGNQPARGSYNGNSKITEESAIRIKQMLAQGVPRVAIAAYVGTTKWIVDDISTGRTWRHVR